MLYSLSAKTKLHSALMHLRCAGKSETGLSQEVIIVIPAKRIINRRLGVVVGYV
jgi:hypothetical protein